MAQGKMKFKNTNFQKKAKRPNKDLGPKKGGGRKIAPKKKQKLKEKNIKMNLQKAINANIEHELAQKAGTSSLTLVKGDTTATDISKKAKKSGKS